jgi:hypothetical protein
MNAMGIAANSAMFTPLLVGLGVKTGFILTDYLKKSNCIFGG